MHKEGDALAGASDTTGDPLGNRRADEAVEINPITFYGKADYRQTDESLYDFTPKAEEEVIGLEDVDLEEVEAGDPKGSSVPGSALSAIYEQVKTPERVAPVEESESLNDPETTVSVDKDSTKVEESQTGNDSGSPTSPSQTSNGKNKQNAQSQE
jgi:hypothetical protein